MSSWYQLNPAGLDRIRKFYNKNEVCLEREFVLKTTKLTFLTTFFLGGLSRRAEANRRVQIYTTGVTFASPSLRVSRIWDYKILEFMKNGFKWGARSTLLTGTITMAITHLTLYRDRFSGWYPPLISASATGVFAFPLGVYGCAQAMSLGAVVGSTITGVAYLYALYIDGTIDEAYKKYRSLCEAELLELKDYQHKIIQIMKRDNLWMTFSARKRLEATGT
ncbi:Translocase of inner mitochondrial membrane [Aphelenchoides bicaudatus]|nr:Translocase of inner mitochondrial membrane [Aphelenchoides bicaudatus]